MQSHKLIVADFDVELVENIASHFRKLGCEVKTAYDALTILKLAHLDTPDAFVLGADLKCDNGVCVCEFLASERMFSHFPTVLLVDDARDQYRHDCHGLRAFYVLKGERLPKRIENVLAAGATRLPPAFAES